MVQNQICFLFVCLAVVVSATLTKQGIELTGISREDLQETARQIMEPAYEVISNGQQWWKARVQGKTAKNDAENELIALLEREVDGISRRMPAAVMYCECKTCHKKCSVCGKSSCSDGEGGCTCNSCGSTNKMFFNKIKKSTSPSIVENEKGRLRETVKEFMTKMVSADISPESFYMESISIQTSGGFCCQCTNCNQACSQCGMSCCCNGSNGCTCKDCGSISKDKTGSVLRADSSEIMKMLDKQLFHLDQMVDKILEI